MTFLRFLLTLTVAFVAGCGGGGGGGADSAAVAPRLDPSVTLSYQAANKTEFAYDPWTSVRLDPVVGGNAPAGARKFSTLNLPKGLALDASTGVISGLASEPVNTTLSVDLDIAGYAGFVSAQVRLAVNWLDGTGAATSGLTVASASSYGGKVGVPATLSNSVGVATVGTDGSVTIHQPLPAGAVVVYGLGASTAEGAKINPSTGAISWTPPAPGQFNLTWIADVTFKGVTRRYTSPVFLFDIT